LIARLANALGVDRQELLLMVYPEARQLVGQPNGARSRKSTSAWLSFTNDQKLLARYHMTATELQTFAPVLAAIPLSPKQYLTVLVLMRDAMRLNPKAQPGGEALGKDGANRSSQSFSGG
jgi:hypothetical protein